MTGHLFFLLSEETAVTCQMNDSGLGTSVRPKAGSIL